MRLFQTKSICYSKYILKYILCVSMHISIYVCIYRYRHISYSFLNIYEQIRHNIIVWLGRAHCSQLNNWETDSLMVYLKMCLIESYWDWVTWCGNLQQNDSSCKKTHSSFWCKISHPEQIQNPHLPPPVKAEPLLVETTKIRPRWAWRYPHFWILPGHNYPKRKGKYFFQINQIHLYTRHI